MREFINNVQLKEKCMHKECFGNKFSPDFKINVGNKVYKKNLAPLKLGQNKKLQTKWIGPNVIEETFNVNINYKIFLLNSGTAKMEIIHQRRLTLAYVDDNDNELSSDSDEYEDASDLSYVPGKDASQHTVPLQPTTQSNNSDESDDGIGAVHTLTQYTK